MINDKMQQIWQKKKTGRIIESHELGLVQMVGLLQEDASHGEAAPEESSGKMVYAAACRGLEGK